jgi:hypothetical protein
MAYDLLIKNGRIIDGSKMPAFRGDAGIRNGKMIQWASCGARPPAPSMSTAWWLHRILSGGSELCGNTSGRRSRADKEKIGEGDDESTSETCQRNPVDNQPHLVRTSHPPEASLASSSAMAARSVDSTCKGRVIEPRQTSTS